MNILDKPILLNIDDKYNIEIIKLKFSDKINDDGKLEILYDYNICAKLDNIEPKIDVKMIDDKLQKFLYDLLNNVKIKE